MLLNFYIELLNINLINCLFSFRFIAIKLFAIAFCINNRHFSVCKELSLLNFKTILYIRKNKKTTKNCFHNILIISLLYGLEKI